MRVISKSWLLLLIVCFACDDGDTGGGDPAPDSSVMGGAGGERAAGGAGGEGGEGAAGGEGGAGAMGGAGGEGGAGPMGGEGGAGPMGGEGGGMGGEGGGMDPCGPACARIADCAAGDDWCPDLGPGDVDAVIEGCVDVCTPEQADFINNAAACEDFMGIIISSSAEFGEQCGGEEEACATACARLGECAAGEEYCPDIGAPDEAGVVETCLTECTLDVATFINGTSMCSEFMPFVISNNEPFAAQCGEMLDPETVNCLAVYDATCETFGGCNVVIDDGMGGTFPFSDACAAGRGAIEGGFIPCGGEMDDYSDREAVDACAAAIRATPCAEVCDDQPSGPPPACDGILVVEAAVQMCEPQ